jgi:hypothetical protein
LPLSVPWASWAQSWVSAQLSGHRGSPRPNRPSVGVRAGVRRITVRITVRSCTHRGRGIFTVGFFTGCCIASPSMLPACAYGGSSVLRCPLQEARKHHASALNGQPRLALLRCLQRRRLCAPLPGPRQDHLLVYHGRPICALQAAPPEWEGEREGAEWEGSKPSFWASKPAWCQAS